MPRGGGSPAGGDGYLGTSSVLARYDYSSIIQLPFRSAACVPGDKFNLQQFPRPTVMSLVRLMWHKSPKALQSLGEVLTHTPALCTREERQPCPDPLNP
jgi:hypothetical protein